jgi:23S rRNA (uridine2552-2'-O)-methyltransferase
METPSLPLSSGPDRSPLVMNDKPSSGARGLSVRLKTARGRSTSQQKWLSRQLNDPYVIRAKREGYRSRAAYKLIEIDEKVHLLKSGQRVVDLGAAPGGWLQVAAKKIGLEQGNGKIVGIDLLEIDPMSGVSLMQLDFTAENAPDILKDMLGGEADLVLSDMAANTTGHKKTDHLKIMALAEMAISFAREVLAPGGGFLCKVLQGGTENVLLTDLKRDFTMVKHLKPKASRADSSELYVLAMGFRGRQSEQADSEN